MLGSPLGLGDTARSSAGTMPGMRPLLPVIALLLSACGSFPTIEQERQTASSGFVGCAPDEIAISAQARYTWTATCRGRVHYCTVSPALACSAAK